MTAITRRGFLGLIGAAIASSYATLAPLPFSLARLPDTCRVRIWLEAKGCRPLTDPCDIVVKRVGNGFNYQNVEPFELTVLRTGVVTWACIDVDGRGLKRIRCGAGAVDEFRLNTASLLVGDAVTISALELTPAVKTLRRG